MKQNEQSCKTAIAMWTANGIRMRGPGSGTNQMGHQPLLLPLAAEEIVEIQEEIAEAVAEASADDVPSVEIAEQVIEAANEAASESELTLGDCTAWVADPDIVFDDQQAEECAAMLAAAVEACEGLECFPDNESTEPETPVTTAPPEEQPEPEPEPTITTPPEAEETATPTTVPETEPEPEQEQTEATTTTTPPEPEPEPEPEPVVVRIGDPDFVPATTGIVPVPFPECSADESTWDETCTPPSSWDWGEFRIGYRVFETPRLTSHVVAWYEACRSWGAPCDWFMGLMKWPLDYLGAHPYCVIDNPSGPGEYQRRVETFINNPNNTVGEIQNEHGWHNCATVIDPLVEQPPTGRTKRCWLSAL